LEGSLAPADPTEPNDTDSNSETRKFFMDRSFVWVDVRTVLRR
jgi:hypothetical protein